MPLYEQSPGRIPGPCDHYSERRMIHTKVLQHVVGSIPKERIYAEKIAIEHSGSR